MDRWLRRFREAKVAEGFEKVLVPGDPERDMETIRKKNGIPLMKAVIEDLEYLADRFKISTPG